MSVKSIKSFENYVFTQHNLGAKIDTYLNAFTMPISVKDLCFIAELEEGQAKIALEKMTSMIWRKGDYVVKRR